MCFLTLVFQTDPGVISLWCSGQTEYFQDSSQDALELKRRAGWRRRIDVVVIIPLCMRTSWCNCPVWMYGLYTLMIVSNKLFRFLLNKICYYLLYIVPLRCEVLYYVFFFFFYLFLLFYPLFFFIGIRDSRGREFRVATFGIRAKVRSTLALEQKVKREPWLCVGFTH